MKKFILVLALILAGCSSKYRIDRFEAPSQPLSSSGSGYVMLARDGAYGAQIYPGSGSTVSRHLHNAVSAYLSRAELGKTVESRDHALAKARAMNMTYLFEPTGPPRHRARLSIANEDVRFL